MIEGFDEIVLAWEKHELFYKELYEKKKGNPAEYRRFLSQLNVEDLREEGLVVPDLYDTFEIYGETTPIFDLNTDIAVWKHSRYTPAYLHAHRYFEIVCVVSDMHDTASAAKLSWSCSPVISVSCRMESAIHWKS